MPSLTVVSCAVGLLALAGSAAGSAAFSASGTSLVLALGGPQDLPEDLFAWSEQVTQAAESLQQRCGHLAAEMQSLRKRGPAEEAQAEEGFMETSSAASAHTGVGDVLARLSAVVAGFRGLEAPARDTLGALRAAAGLLRRRSAAELEIDWSTEEALAELPEARSRILVCLLSAAGEARGLLPRTPRGPASAAGPSLDVGQADGPLAAVEALAVAEAEADLGDADVQFGLGLYWSDVGLADAAGGAASWESSWLQDAAGVSAPPAFVHAERLLKGGERNTASPAIRSDRAALRALRLYRHAKVMALRHHSTAAVWRYRAAAKLAIANRRSRLAAHSFTRLGYFLYLGGELAQAFAAVSEALAINTDSSDDGGDGALAQFLQATLSRRLGELRSEADGRRAEEQLLAVAGKMPSQALEAERLAAHGDLVAWRNAAAAPSWSLHRSRQCSMVGDAARFLICMLCSVAFA